VGLLVDGDGRLGLLRQRDIVLNAASQHGTPTSGEDPVIGKVVTKSQLNRGRGMFLWRRKFCIYTTLIDTPPIQVEDKMIPNSQTTSSHSASGSDLNCSPSCRRHPQPAEPKIQYALLLEMCQQNDVYTDTPTSCRFCDTSPSKSVFSVLFSAPPKRPSSCFCTSPEASSLHA
jgi:hypothetical protein